jgi:preprotein translocase subunit Sec63
LKDLDAFWGIPSETPKSLFDGYSWIIAVIICFSVIALVKFIRGRFKLRQNINRKNKNPYTILELDPNCSLQDIKNAYRKKVKQYHPDKLSQCADEFKLLAELRTKEINWAYDRLMLKHRNDKHL